MGVDVSALVQVHGGAGGKARVLLNVEIVDLLKSFQNLGEKAFETIKQAVAKDSELSNAVNDTLSKMNGLVGTKISSDSTKTSASSLIDTLINTSNKAVVFLEQNYEMDKISSGPITALSTSLENLRRMIIELKVMNTGPWGGTMC